MIAGYTYSFGAGNTNVYFLKTDSLGRQDWQRTFGAVEEDKGYAIVLAPDGGFVIAGYTGTNGISGREIQVIKTDKNGER